MLNNVKHANNTYEETNRIDRRPNREGPRRPRPRAREEGRPDRVANRPDPSREVGDQPPPSGLTWWSARADHDSTLHHRWAAGYAEATRYSHAERLANRLASCAFWTPCRLASFCESRRGQG